VCQTPPLIDITLFHPREVTMACTSLLLLCFIVVACVGQQYPVAGKNYLGPSTYDYVLASKLRVSYASSVIDKSYLYTGSETTDTTRTYARSLGLPDDDAGHILANRLGGSGRDPVNIFPQNLSINRGQWRVFEDHIHDCVNQTSDRIAASLDWTFSYSGEGTRATSIVYCVKYSAIPTCEYDSECQTFSNPE